MIQIVVLSHSSFVIFFNVVSDQIGSNKFRSLMYLKILRSLVEPGEAVGLLAAQVRESWMCCVFMREFDQIICFCGEGSCECEQLFLYTGPVLNNNVLIV
jgi:hypothetical protein